MLAGTFVLQERNATMGISDEHDSFTAPSKEIRTVYFGLPDGRSTRSDSSSSEDMLIEEGNVSSTSSSPVPFPDSQGVPGDQEENDSAAVSKTNNSTCDLQTPCVRPKYGGDIIIGLPDTLSQTQKDSKKSEKPKKKKKWRTVLAEDMGFRLTLFPRVSVAACDEKEMEKEQDVFESLLETEPQQFVVDKAEPFAHLLRFEGTGLRKEEKAVRKDKHHRVKPRKELKTKNITLGSLLNIRVQRTLYIHFRLYKRFEFLHCPNHEHPNLPSLPKREGVCMEVAKSGVKAQARAAREAGWRSTPSNHRRPPPVQNLAHALDNNNAASELPTDIISFLINIQHREMTPEDYEMLLRLDEGVAPKTVDVGVISSFKTDIVDESTAGEGVCSVCMEGYEVGQERKFLPCEHVFHVQCIDMWLANSSQNCPLDGLPVGFS